MRAPAAALLVLALAAPGAARAANSSGSAAADSPVAIQSVVRASLAANHLRAAIVEVRRDGRTVYTGAFGVSMTGVPATTEMHFRNGALAFTYMATLLLELCDRKKVSLDTKLSTFYPQLPNAGRITLRELAQMTSGYADYVYQQEVIDGLYLDPFRQWTPEELVRIGVGKPMQFEPGTNWGYSHTNYVILGGVLQKIAGMPLLDALKKYVLDPMGLHETSGNTTPAIPEPALHSFTSERRETLGVASNIPFFEESTYWNPSWTTFDQAVETTTIDDASVSMEAVGTGKLLSAASSAAQIAPNLLGFGHRQSNCPACRKMDRSLTYGLGVILSGTWVMQTLGFAGASGAVGYLPAQRLTIAVEATNSAAAYDNKGNAGLGASAVFRALANAIAPSTLPPPDPSP